MKWSLEWLADSAGVSNRIQEVYEVENLLGQLTAHANCPKSPFAIDDLLKTSSYDHDSCTRWALASVFGWWEFCLHLSLPFCPSLNLPVPPSVTLPILCRCGYHEELECSHCSLGICHTYCYVASELLCRMYGVSLTRKHLPTFSSDAVSATAVARGLALRNERTRRPSDTESTSSENFLHVILSSAAYLKYCMCTLILSLKQFDFQINFCFTMY